MADIMRLLFFVCTNVKRCLNYLVVKNTIHFFHRLCMKMYNLVPWGENDQQHACNVTCKPATETKRWSKIVIAQSTLKSTYRRYLRLIILISLHVQTALHAEDHIHVTMYMLQVKIKCRLILFKLVTKIVETLHPNTCRVTSQNKRIHTTPPTLHSKLGCLLFSMGGLNSGTLKLHGGMGRKSFISPFWSE